MNVAETLVSTLKPRGWAEEPLPPSGAADARLAYAKGAGRIAIENRPARKELWLWLYGQGDKQCLGLSYAQGGLEKTLAKVAAMQDALSFDDYLSNYGDLQQACSEVSIVCWEQFEPPAPPPPAKPRPPKPPAPSQEELVARAQEAQRALAAGAGGEADPVVFPEARVAKLSDYVAIMKRVQKGDMMGALGAYGLDFMSWGKVAQAWGGKMASDAVLTAKFSQLMAQG
jgi:hypothetical protein